jgi:hypothetical protein
MELGLLVRARAQEGDWGVESELAGVGWEERNLGQDQRELAYVPIAAPRSPTKWECLAII